MSLSLADYPTAVHSYFSVRNVLQEKEKFIRNEIEFPSFEYGALFNESILNDRLFLLEQDLKAADEDQRQSLSLHIKQTKYLLSARQLQESNSAPELINSFRQQGKDLHGKPTVEYTSAILGMIESQVQKNTHHHELWEYIASNTTYNSDTAVHLPDDVVFAHYRKMFMRYAPFLYQPETHTSDDVEEFMILALDSVEARKYGWSVQMISTGSNARVSYRHKKVLVGRHYKPHSAKGLRSVVAHEVYGHVNRNKIEVRGFEPFESEGVAIMLEQLLSSTCSAKRAYRYLAIAAGWGILGHPMNFREVYEIIWRAMVIRSGYAIDVAKDKAFNECTRAFRGGRPDVPGAVFTKDIVYFEGNMKVWNVLINDNLSYDSFVDILEGRKKVVI